MKTIVYDWLDATDDVRFLVWDHTIEWGERHANLEVFPSHEWSLEEVIEVALELGDCNVVGDEVDVECDSKQGLLRGSPIHTIANYGRHHNVGFLWGCRRANDIPRGLTANTNHLFLLQTDEPGDLDWIERRTRSKEVRNRAASLSPGDWFYVRC